MIRPNTILANPRQPTLFFPCLQFSIYRERCHPSRIHIFNPPPYSLIPAIVAGLPTL
ncbi:hypothetical protein Y027_4983 [Burkholderia pseudomallei TSV5]|nr:hypothetical protein X948_4968 [Burkholderia pseudomallei MSHR5608]KGS39267.1 hypothetical protein X992_5260 [Burkholderia pseudomallei MSHR5492]KGS76153.1 hypothetical protein X942_5082 [Burkholderia pseudomallei MSHR5596]KGX52131.1 hypothetical protein Y027_4983 [Burkholderia pseudomallei TSV5]KGX52481.1 hypothetical protein Y025_4865 [Burkholderia pseudomallei TSV32]